MIIWILTDKLLRYMQFSTIASFAACELLLESFAVILLVWFVVW